MAAWRALGVAANKTWKFSEMVEVWWRFVEMVEMVEMVEQGGGSAVSTTVTATWQLKPTATFEMGRATTQRVPVDVLAENAARIFGKIHRNCALSAILGAVERARAEFALAGAAAVRSSAHAEIACPDPLPLPVTHFVPANSSARMRSCATNELRTGHSRGKTNGRDSTVTTMARACSAAHRRP